MLDPDEIWKNPGASVALPPIIGILDPVIINGAFAAIDAAVGAVSAF